ncbi:MAG: PD40 domain-containing protein [Acidobacteriia bacterium]|nr:PD40 domain-containing protein [Terriglobia bacterium]
MPEELHLGFHGMNNGSFTTSANVRPWARSRIVVTPVSLSRTSGAKDEIGVTAGDFTDILPEFSPNGKLIYFISNRDTFTCLWVIALIPPPQNQFVILSPSITSTRRGARPGL